MPDIDRTVDIKVTADGGMVTAAIPLAGHASEFWLTVFRARASHGGPEPSPEAEQREDRAWVIVKLPVLGRDLHPEMALDAVSALISEVNGMEQELQSAGA